MTTSHPQSIDEATLSRLRDQVSGPVYTPTDAQFDDVRQIWNGTIQRSPAVIIRCSSEADVQAAVRFAVEREMPLTVCGGGHNVAGLAIADGAVMIDLRDMRSVVVDPAAQTARVAGGAMLGDVDQATRPHGLSVPVGVATETGIAGLTLGGGLGWLRRKFGLTCDNLIGARVVTADGSVVVANERENPDLLWALQGGGGNFGIVTEFEFQAHPVADDIYFCLVFHPIEAAEVGLQLFRKLAAEAPDDMSGFAILWGVPHDEEAFSTGDFGKDTIVFAAAWSGDPSEGEQFFQPLRDLASPYSDMSGVMPFLDVQQLFDADYPKGGRYYWKSNYLADLPEDAGRVLIDLARKRPSPESTLDVWQLGGAISRVSAAATAYPHRDAPFLLGIEANWHNAEDDGANIEWAREVYAAMEPFAHKGALYINFPGDLEEGDELVRKAYGVNYDRLARVKAQFDPGNMFRTNMNIRPAT
jgi:FAD/FMN-containing dehydrogenase